MFDFAGFFFFIEIYETGDTDGINILDTSNKNIVYFIFVRKMYILLC